MQFIKNVYVWSSLVFQKRIYRILKKVCQTISIILSKVIKVSTILKSCSRTKRKNILKRKCAAKCILEILNSAITYHCIYIRYVLSDMYYTHNKLPHNHWTFLLTHMNKRFGRNLWNASIWHFVCSCFCSVWRWLAIFYWETFRVSN